MYILDTDHLSLLERGGGDSIALQMRLERIPPEEITTTIVTYEEQMRGWLARASHANTMELLVATYARLQTHIDTFTGIPILPFDSRAAAELEHLHKARIRIGTMDRRIAAIALTDDAILLTRNSQDFSRVPGLRFEDWTV